MAEIFPGLITTKLNFFMRIVKHIWKKTKQEAVSADDNPRLFSNSGLFFITLIR